MRARQIKLHPRTRNKLQRLMLESRVDGAYRVSRRIESILLNSDGMTSTSIARQLSASRSQVSLWLKTYDDYGVEGLYEGEHTGRPHGLSEEQKTYLCDIVDSGPVAYGLVTGVWTSPIIRDVIKDEFGVSYHDGHVRKLLKEFGFSVQRPKRILARADKEKKAKWVKTTYPSIKKKPAG